MNKLRLATLWLGGCSGCHMSFLDLDEGLIDLYSKVDIVYSPIVDTKIYPENVDVALIEGAVANEEHVHMLHTVRARTKVLIAFGDCAVAGNVTALRNLHGSPESILQQVYVDNVDLQGQIPHEEINIVPPLIKRVVPVHAVVPVDVYLPGCPPSAARIRAALEQVIAGGPMQLEGPELIKFG